MSNFFLAPLSFIYFMIVSIRNLLFDLRLFKSQSVPARIISVGNLSAGGTGKTPFVDELARRLLKLKKSVAIVSRGYGGNYKQEAIQVNGEEDAATETYGDEPVWYATNLKIPIFVGRKRVQAARLCINKVHPDVIICDDGFQHRWLHRDFDIVLIDANDTATQLLPWGRYREPMSSLKRAHFVVLTKCNLVSEAQLNTWLQLLSCYQFSLENKNLYLSEHKADSIEILRGVDKISKEKKIALASAISQPASFEKLMQDLGYPFVGHYIYKDHHLWSQEDIDLIEAELVKNGIQHLVITEKDAVKMENLIFKYLNVHVLHLRITLQPEFPYEIFLS